MPGMTPAAIGDLVDVSDPRVSPDGRQIAYVVTSVDLEANEYRARIWLADAGAAAPPRPLTSGEHRDLRPRWSPDGRELAFVSHRGEQGSELYVIPVAANGEVRSLAAWPEEIDELAWSPDGTRIGFGARQRDEEQYGPEKDRDRPPRRLRRLTYRLDNVGWTADRVRHLFVVPADGSARPVAVTSGEAQDGGLSWSPDGRRLAFASGRHDTWDLDRAVDLWTVDAREGATPERLTPTGLAYAVPAFSPDGAWLACVQQDPLSSPRHGQIGVVRATGGTVELRTTSLDRQCFPYLAGAREPTWDGEDILFVVEDAGNMHVYRVPGFREGKPELVLGGERAITGFDLAGGTLAFTAATAATLPELSVLRDGREVQLTAHGRRFHERHAVAAPERFTATAPDGAEVEAWIIRPLDVPAGEQRPALLNIHGGPFTQYANKLFDEFQIQAGAGYAVIYCNPRGSSGYSEAWGRAIRGPNAPDDPGTGWGGVDYDDVMAVVDEAIERFPIVDPERLGVLGGSYGGFLTSWIVGHTDRFRAACSERAVNNRFTSSWTSDIGLWFRSYLGASHLDAPEEYLNQSPITYVRDIRTPLLILHSENDLRCPIEQAEQLFVALRLLGREVEFVRFPGEGHELSRSGAPRHRVQRMEIVLDWFARQLGAPGERARD